MQPEKDDSSGLGGRAATGMAWSLLEMFGRYGVTYIVTICLARMLSPRDYGLIGLATAFFAIAAVIIDGGFRSALIRKKNVSQADRNTVFFTNLALAFVMYAAVYLVAPLIAAFYGEPQITILTRLLGVTFITSAMTIVPSVELRRDMRFNKLALITIPAEIFSGAAAIFLAYRGFEAMSLAVKTILASFTVMILYRRAVKWRPTLEFSASSFRELFKTGFKLTTTSILSAVYKNAATLFIGKTYSAQALGHYSISEKILNITSNNITLAVEQVSLSAFSKVQDNSDRLARGYEKSVQGSTALIFPILAALAFMTEPLVALFLGERWIPAAPYIRVMCVTGALAPIYAINGNILMIRDVDTYLKIEYAAVLTLLAALFLLVPLGIEIFLIGQAVHTAVFVVIIDICNSRHAGGRFLAFARYAAPFAALAAAASGVARLMMEFLGGTGIKECIMALTVNISVYGFFISLFTLFKSLKH